MSIAALAQDAAGAPGCATIFFRFDEKMDVF